MASLSFQDGRCCHAMTEIPSSLEVLLAPQPHDVTRRVDFVKQEIRRE
jgi:hypothetical protein